MIRSRSSPSEIMREVARLNEIDDSDAMFTIALSLNAISKEMRAIAVAIEKLAAVTADKHNAR
jgi:hypothetical protein